MSKIWSKQIFKNFVKYIDNLVFLLALYNPAAGVKMAAFKKIKNKN